MTAKGEGAGGSARSGVVGVAAWALTAVGILAAAPGAADGQELKVIRAGGMIDVEEGRLIVDPVVVVDGETIRSVNPASVPDGARTLDLGERTLLPGLMDLHTHLYAELDEDFFVEPVTMTDADLALRAAKNARATLRAGFTTIRDFGYGVDVAVMKAVERGDLEGPDVFPSRNLISITGGHCDVTGFKPGVAEQGPEQGVADGPWEVVEAVRYQIKHGARVIKTCATAGVLSFEGPVGAQQYSFEELEAIVEEARRHGVKVAAHAHGTDGIIAAVRAGVASIEHGSVLNDEAIALMKERGTYLVPTTHLADVIDLGVLPPPVRAKAEAIVPVAKESVRRAIDAGVEIAFGTDVPIFPHGSNAAEFGALVERGMTPAGAIRAATVNAADLLGVDDRGRIEEGLRADLIAVSGNPLDDVSVLERVDFVMEAGRVVKDVGTNASGDGGGEG